MDGPENATFPVTTNQDFRCFAIGTNVFSRTSQARLYGYYDSQMPNSCERVLRMTDESSQNTGPSENAAPPLTIAGKRVISVRRWYRRTRVRSIVFLAALLVLGLHLVMRSSATLYALRLAGALLVLFVAWPLLAGTYTKIELSPNVQATKSSIVCVWGNSGSLALLS
jgi:hypothetical protein